MIPDTPGAAPSDDDRRIAFARDVLLGNQQLIQLMDQKSYLILVIVGVSSAAFFTIVGSFIGKLKPHFDPALLVLATALWFIVEAALVLTYSLRGIRGEVAKPIALEAPGMVFPIAVVKRYDAAAYLTRLQQLSAGDILSDYTAEIIKTANVYDQKFRQVDDAVRALYRSMVPWMVSILATVVLRAI